MHTLWSRSVVKCSICYHNVCPSVALISVVWEQTCWLLLNDVDVRTFHQYCTICWKRYNIEWQLLVFTNSKLQTGCLLWLWVAPLFWDINVKTKFIKAIIGDVVAHLKPQKFTFRQICNVLFHHYSASSILCTSLSHFYMFFSFYSPGLFTYDTMPTGCAWFAAISATAEL